MLCYSSAGSPFIRWLAHGMPQLGRYKYLLDTVFFLYPSEAAARAGEESGGGSGFFVAVPSEGRPKHHSHVYAVTNWHVACQGSPVIRVNTRSGPPDIFDLDVSDWHFVPGGYDLAVAPINLDEEKHVARAIGIEIMLTDEDIGQKGIDVAEDVFMVGRFIDFDGVETNQPSLRFGNVSMMSATVKQPSGSKLPSVVVDMHSRTGYSGSPVFLYRTTGSYFLDGGIISTARHVLKVLGVLWGQFPERWELRGGSRASPRAHGEPALTTDGRYVAGMSGMSCVVPARAVRELLDTPELRRQRAEAEAELDRLLGWRGEPAVAMSAETGDRPGRDDWHEPAEAARRRDETLRQMLSTPPRPGKSGKPPAS